MTDMSKVDLFVIGGGINGAGIARDAAGRGLSVEPVRVSRFSMIGIRLTWMSEPLRKANCTIRQSIAAALKLRPT